MINDVDITISLFEHDGKVHCQSKTLGLVKECCARSHTDISKAFLLLVDSDTRVARNSLFCSAHISLESLAPIENLAIVMHFQSLRLFTGKNMARALLLLNPLGLADVVPIMQIRHAKAISAAHLLCVPQ